MFDKRLTDNINTHNNLKTVIVTGTKIKGEISGADEFYLEGELEGELKLDSLLILKEGGKLKGKVEADNIIIEGKMDGEIHAKNKIEVRASGRFSGTIDCNKIAI